MATWFLMHVTAGRLFRQKNLCGIDSQKATWSRTKI